MLLSECVPNWLALHVTAVYIHSWHTMEMAYSISINDIIGQFYYIICTCLQLYASWGTLTSLPLMKATLSAEVSILFTADMHYVF